MFCKLLMWFVEILVIQCHTMKVGNLANKGILLFQRLTAVLVFQLCTLVKKGSQISSDRKTGLVILSTLSSKEDRRCLNHPQIKGGLVSSEQANLWSFQTYCYCMPKLHGSNCLV